MGVQTKADELIDEAKSDIKSAAKNLAQFTFDDETWGVDDYSAEYKDKVADVLRTLTQLIRQL